jgi:hypothetical protein
VNVGRELSGLGALSESVGIWRTVKELVAIRGVVFHGCCSQKVVSFILNMTSPEMYESKK